MDTKNSMLLANMMSQKPKIMYVTIKGTLTENDGVFSGFSTSNYLQLQNELDFSRNFKFAIKFKTSSNITSEQFIIYHNRYPNQTQFALSCHTNSKLLIYYLSVSETRLYTDLITLEVDTEYNVVIEYTISNINVYVNNIFVKTIEVNYSNFIQAPILFGMGGSSSYFRGSIDLNNSYIKLGSTKYNLQAVVGYTIVGSPTLTDGVLTSASSGNYLSITGKEFSNNNFELLFKFEVDDANKTIFFNTRNNSHYFLLRVDNNNKIVLFVRDSGSQTILSDNAISLNTIYWVKLNRTGNTITMFISTDGINYIKQTTTIETTETFTSITSWFGYENFYSSGANFSGKLYVKDCRIWIDNKLWFNGQQA